jgi:hypothetical protein
MVLLSFCLEPSVALLKGLDLVRGIGFPSLAGHLDSHDIADHTDDPRRDAGCLMIDILAGLELTRLASCFAGTLTHKSRPLRPSPRPSGC